jgi:hypothetical protein
METKSTSVSIPPPDDLIEVKKPTSLLIAQFFLFPLIIIAICIGIFLLFGYLTYEQKTPQEYLSDVRTGSELCCRWQSAYELSNIISSQKDKLRNTDFVNDLVKVYQGSREGDPRSYLALTMGHLHGCSADADSATPREPDEQPAGIGFDRPRHAQCG